MSLAQARARLGDLIAWLCNFDGTTERRAVLVLRRGRPVAALMPALEIPAASLFAVNRSPGLPAGSAWFLFDNMDEARREFLGVVADVAEVRSPGALIEPGRIGRGRIVLVYTDKVLEDVLARRPRVVLERLFRLQPAFRPPRRAGAPAPPSSSASASPTT